MYYSSLFWHWIANSPPSSHLPCPGCSCCTELGQPNYAIKGLMERGVSLSALQGAYLPSDAARHPAYLHCVLVPRPFTSSSTWFTRLCCTLSTLRAVGLYQMSCAGCGGEGEKWPLALYLHLWREVGCEKPL